MTQALKELLAKVEAGEKIEPHEVTAALRPVYSGEEPVVAHFMMALSDADIRAMGAAKALHEALLGDRFPWSIGEEAGRLQGDPSRWCVGIFSYDADKTIAWAVHELPARAWLI